MSSLILAIGNKNYSSWSLRPWLVLRHFDIPFEEIQIPLYAAGSKEQLAHWSPSGKVPALHDGTLVVWDSLAICEYLAERFPQFPLWPHVAEARAVARAVSAEMHAGFGELRRAMPMNCRGRFPGKGLNADVHADIERITSLWRDCRQRFASEGEFLFGHFSIADAMYAPVVLRFQTYGVPLPGDLQRYADAILAMPALREWLAAAQVEEERIEAFEIYR